MEAVNLWTFCTTGVQQQCSVWQRLLSITLGIAKWCLRQIWSRAGYNTNLISFGIIEHMEEQIKNRICLFLTFHTTWIILHNITRLQQILSWDTFPYFSLSAFEWITRFMASWSPLCSTFPWNCRRCNTSRNFFLSLLQGTQQFSQGKQWFNCTFYK